MAMKFCSGVIKGLILKVGRFGEATEETEWVGRGFENWEKQKANNFERVSNLVLFYSRKAGQFVISWSQWANINHDVIFGWFIFAKITSGNLI